MSQRGGVMGVSITLRHKFHRFDTIPPENKVIYIFNFISPKGSKHKYNKHVIYVSYVSIYRCL